MRGKWFRLSVNRPYLISAEALVLAVAVHVLLFYLAGYEPEKHISGSAGGGGVTLLNVAALPDPEQQMFERWLKVQDPALIARADHDSSYAALVRDRGERPFGTRRTALSCPAPAVRALPGFSPLPVAAGDETEPDCRFELFSYPFPRSVPERRQVQVFDGAFRKLSLPLEVPEAAGKVAAPTVIVWWRAGAFLRIRLEESCGNPEFDSAALHAVSVAGGALSGNEGVVTVCWPEPEVRS